MQRSGGIVTLMPNLPSETTGLCVVDRLSVGGRLARIGRLRLLGLLLRAGVPVMLGRQTKLTNMNSPTVAPTAACLIEAVTNLSAVWCCRVHEPCTRVRIFPCGTSLFPCQLLLDQGAVCCQHLPHLPSACHSCCPWLTIPGLLNFGVPVPGSME